MFKSSTYSQNRLTGHCRALEYREWCCVRSDWWHRIKVLRTPAAWLAGTAALPCLPHLPVALGLLGRLAHCIFHSGKERQEYKHFLKMLWWPWWRVRGFICVSYNLAAKSDWLLALLLRCEMSIWALTVLTTFFASNWVGQNQLLLPHFVYLFVQTFKSIFS